MQSNFSCYLLEHGFIEQISGFTSNTEELNFCVNRGKKKNSQALRSVVFGFIASKQERKLTTYANTKIKKSKKLNNILKVNIFLNQDF